MRRAIKNLLKSCWVSLFHLGQRFGFDILPRHFYSEIPDIRKLKSTHQWRKPFTLIGVEGNALEEQLQFVRATVAPALAARLAKGDVYSSACERNGEPGYGPVEADFLYAFIATHRPPSIVQVGCGVSTAVCLIAAAEAGYRPRLVCVDPYPTAFLRQAAGAGEVELVDQPAELLGHDVISTLGKGDLFFVDSTHTLGPGGEVSRIVLEWLPRLAEGVYVHFHDILFPYDYPVDILSSQLVFSHESALLHAFLACNRRFRIAASLSMLHYHCARELRELLPNYRPCANQDGLRTGPGHFPSAIYLKVTS